uniref:Putative secreted protein n=1 Tax=Amblyomma triste TaxID=251400 RepID=A0A023G3Q4_AMBTT
MEVLPITGLLCQVFWLSFLSLLRVMLAIAILNTAPRVHLLGMFLFSLGSIRRESVSYPQWRGFNIVVSSQLMASTSMFGHNHQRKNVKC